MPVVEVPPHAVGPVCEWCCLGRGRSGSEQRAAPPALSTSTLAVSPHLLLPPLTIITTEEMVGLLSAVVPQIDPSVPQPVVQLTITEKAPT